MAKTQETLRLEDALRTYGQKKREYGCEEVTIGFHNQGHGDEIVDFMSMDSEEVFRCYEIKVTLSDLKTDNRKSFYGDYNYLVVSPSLYARNPAWGNYIPPYAGILCGTDLTVKRQAKKKDITDETRSMLKDSLLRSVFWKYQNYRKADNLEEYRDLEKKLQEKEEQFQQLRQLNDRIIWTYQDYENWYRKNHQDASFSIEESAKKERQEYQLRLKHALSWIKKDDDYECPFCHHHVNQMYPFCPYCGKDLRESKD